MQITKKLLYPAVLGAAAFVGIAGGSAVTSLTANAASATTTPTTTTAATGTSQQDQTQGGHVGDNGTKEAVLTGDTASKAKAAAEAAVPGATVQRVENDAEGATYEAHLTKSDGSRVTVKLDANFKVTSVENGPNGSGAEQGGTEDPNN
ncbi:MAG: hypothetical protein JWS12_543 [Candidatus Saccharibacteria bacterium]|nr:hypothetical protein [Candidatus Saccharibacteria bacterium]